MMEFLAANFNLPTIIVGAIVLPLSDRVGEGGAGQGFGPRPFYKPKVRVI